MEFITGQIYKVTNDVKFFIKLPDFKNDKSAVTIFVPKNTLITYLSVINRVATDIDEKVYTKKFIYNDQYVYDAKYTRLTPENYISLVLMNND